MKINFLWLLTENIFFNYWKNVPFWVSCIYKKALGYNQKVIDKPIRNNLYLYSSQEEWEYKFQPRDTSISLKKTSKQND